MMIQFNRSYEKVIEALVYVANLKPGLTAYYLNKIFYFAEKEHLKKYGRPIIGDQYNALADGPAAMMVYDFVNDNFLYEHVEKKFYDALEMRCPDGKKYPELYPLRKPDESYLSKTDIDCLAESVRNYAELSFPDLRKISHDEEAWKQAERNGPMDYRLMIDEDTPNREVLIERLEEYGSQIAL